LIRPAGGINVPPAEADHQLKIGGFTVGLNQYRIAAGRS
jgi:hypothetical protein